MKLIVKTKKYKYIVEEDDVGLVTVTVKKRFRTVRVYKPHGLDNAMLSIILREKNPNADTGMKR